MSAIKNIRGGLAFIRDVGRLRQILAVLVRHGYGEIVERLNFGGTVVGKLTGVRDEGGERVPLETRTLDAIQELGPTFVKLGQILSTRPDLIPPEFVAEFQTLQDNVSPISATVVREQIEASLGRPIDEVFERFDDDCLASASIAQVHRAAISLDGGEPEEVVLKVLRPGISETIAKDLDILKFLANRVHQLIPEARLLDLPGIVTEFERAILKEVDFTFEADHLRRFAQDFEKIDFINFPKLYRELSTDSVLTMEFIEGTKITKVGDEVIPREELVKRAVFALFTMAFENGFFHGDMHPGNVLIQGDGSICFIDCGLTGRLTPTMRDQLVDLLVGVVRQDYELVAESLYEISIKTAPVDWDRFVGDVVEVMDEYLVGKTLSEVQFGALFGDLFDGALRHQLRIPAEYTMFFKSILTVEGIGKAIAPDVDIVTELRPFIERLVKQRYAPETVMRQVLRDGRSLGRFLREFPKSARSIMHLFERGDAGINVRLADATEMATAQITAANRLALAVVTGALILAGTMALDYERYTIANLPAVSLVLYVLAAGSGIIFWSIFLRPHKKRKR